MLSKMMMWPSAILLLLVISGCSYEEQAPPYTGLRELPALKQPLPMDRSETLSPVMKDVYNRSIPEEVYSD
ncbi:hypothetical protein [Paenibacillus sp. sgz500958]|uniref:hypothetical protein n=1 Tax=Paenibacillus sp. sgz500958 TaxID=3242475 RepID=UPI0036D3C60A